MSKPDDATAESLTTDQAFDLLGNDQRRRALTVLRESDESVNLGELAEATAACAEGADSDDVTPDQRERTATMLHHAHLPRLEDAEVVSYDPGTGKVELTGVAEELDPYFELAEEYSEM